MSRVRSFRGFPIHVWIPPQYTTNFKVEIERKDGTVDDITNIVSVTEVEDGLTTGQEVSIGNFKFDIWNPNETYTGVWTGNEIFRYYKDYAATATTLRFRGRVEKPVYSANKIKVSGRSEGVKLIEVTVTKQFSDTETSTIFKSIISSYAPGFTITNIQTSTVNLTVNWYQKPFWECVQELCKATGFVAKLDADLDFHYFEEGTIDNTTDAIVHEYNLLEVGEFADDLSQIKNRIIVYGANQQDIQLLYTAESKDLNYGVDSDLGVREEIIEDNNMTNQTQVQELAEFILAQRQNPQQIGEVKGIILATILPGQNMRVSSPLDNLPPKPYFISKYKDVINVEGGGLTTTVTISKEPRRVFHMMKDIISNQSKSKTVSINPQEMRFSYNFLFDNDSGSHSNTQIIDSVLKLSTGSSGNWISPIKSIPDNVTEAYIIANGETLTGATFEVSGNGGSTYQTISNRNKIDITTTVGTSLRLKVTFTSADTQITSLSLLYR